MTSWGGDFSLAAFAGLLIPLVLVVTLIVVVVRAARRGEFSKGGAFSAAHGEPPGGFEARPGEQPDTPHRSRPPRHDGWLTADEDK